MTPRQKIEKLSSFNWVLLASILQTKALSEDTQDSDLFDSTNTCNLLERDLTPD